MIKIIPILLGVVGSYIVALIFGQVDFAEVGQADLVGLQHFVLAKFDITSILVMAPIAIAAMMEHIGDVSAISSTTGKNFIEDPGLHRTLLGDGIATAVAGLFGGPANTTYGENTGARSMTPGLSVWRRCMRSSSAFLPSSMRWSILSPLPLWAASALCFMV